MRNICFVETGKLTRKEREMRFFEFQLHSMDWNFGTHHIPSGMVFLGLGINLQVN